MANRFASAAARLHQRLGSHAGVDIVYLRQAASVAVVASIGQTLFQSDNGTGVTSEFESRDFLVAAADLVLDGSQTLPKAGDRIRETAGGVTYVYEIMAPGNEPVWRYSDRERLMLRIHTKQVATE